MSSRIDQLAEILRTTPGNSREDQRSRMMKAMQRTGHITTFEAMRFLDVYDPRPRIYELRGEGKSVKTVMRVEQTESGEHHRIGMYILEGRTNG